MADEQERGPLEQEIDDAIRRAVLSEPDALAMLTGTMSEADFDALPPTERQRLIQKATARNIEVLRDAILRIAREIDAINAPPDSGQ